MRLHQGVCLGGPRAGQTMVREKIRVPVALGTDIPFHALQFGCADSRVEIGTYVFDPPTERWLWEDPV